MCVSEPNSVFTLCVLVITLLDHCVHLRPRVYVCTGGGRPHVRGE